MKHKFLTGPVVITVLLLLYLHSPAQVIQNFIDVKGSVVDEHGTQLKGVSIVVKNTSIGTSSGEDGSFEIKQVAADGILVISGIGLQTREFAIRGQGSLGLITISRHIKDAEEVIVQASTGYQTIKPNEVNGSVVVIDQEQLNRQAGTNILKRLDGAVSGLLFNTNKNNNNPQNKTGISIRGTATISGPLDPLIVLDGFIYEGNIDNINPNDVESVTVLKDAAAASVWGARAGNGVIVITTRQGIINQKMQVSISSGLIFSEKPDLKAIPQITPAEFVEMEEFLFNKGFFNDQLAFYPFFALSPATRVLLNRKQGLISAADSASQMEVLKNTDTRSQFKKYVYQKARVQQHAFNLRGGGRDNGYSFSAGYDNSFGTLREEYHKLNLRLANTIQLLPKLRFTLENYYTNSKGLTGQRAYGELRPANRAMLYYDITDDAGIDLEFNSQYTDTLFNGRLLSLKYHPLADYKYNSTTTRLQEINSNAGINYTIKNWLNVDVKYQYQVQQSTAERLVQKNAYEARDIINNLIQVDPQTQAFKYIVPNAGFRVLTNAAICSQTARAQANLNKKFGRHRIDGIAGVESREVKGIGDSYRTYGYNADPLTYTAVDFVTTYSSPISGYDKGVSGSPTASSTVYRFTAIYANASWLYKNKYSLSASGRRDGSNIFGANTNDRWMPLMSAGASWRISNEPFFRMKAVNDFRLKLSYGKSGNVDLSKTAVPIATIFGSDPTTNLPFSRIRQLNNPSLKWEQVSQLNIGADLALFNSRITGSLEWYSKHGADLYGPIAWDYTSFGSNSTILQNVAHTKGRGVDLLLSSANLQGKFGWRTNLLLSYNKTVTEKYYGPQANAVNLLLGGGNKITPIVGKAVYGIMAYKWGGLDSLGNPQGYLNGQLSKDYPAMATESATGSNLRYFGSGTPGYFSTILNQFSYKGFELSVSIVGKFQYHFFKPALSYNALINGNPGNEEYSKRWKQPGDELTTDVPSFSYPNNSDRDYFYSVSTVNVLKGDHIRLQYINLAYSPTIKKIKNIRTLQFYANAANLGILWRANARGIDPDFPASYAPTTDWAFGVRATF